MKSRLVFLVSLRCLLSHRKIYMLVGVAFDAWENKQHMRVTSFMRRKIGIVPAIFRLLTWCLESSSVANVDVVCKCSGYISALMFCVFLLLNSHPLLGNYIGSYTGPYTSKKSENKLLHTFSNRYLRAGKNILSILHWHDVNRRSRCEATAEAGEAFGGMGRPEELEQVAVVTGWANLPTPSCLQYKRIFLN